MNLLSLPVLIPLFGGAVLLLIRKTEWRNAFAILMAALILIADLAIFRETLSQDVLVMQMANWSAPWGISLVADRLTGILLALSGFVGLLTVIFASSSLQHPARRGQSKRHNTLREQLGFQALLLFLFMGVNMSFLTGDLFNLFVAFEVMLVASYGLLLLGNELPQLREGFKYVIVNLIASAFFVVAAGFTYGLVGTLNMADIAQKVALHGPDNRITLIAMLLALVFTTKAAIFPLGFWLPNTYPTPAAPVSAFFAAILTKVGAYALIRSFTLLFPTEDTLKLTLLVLTGLTLLIGGFGAIARRRWRHSLSFANVASIGYLVMGAFIGTQAGLSAAIYYLINSVLVIFTLFLIAALAEKIAGERYNEGGHLSVYPWLGVGFFIAALALAGLPPTSGFIGKFALIKALFETGQAIQLWVAISAVLTGFLLLYACIQIWQGWFWGESDAVHRVPLPRTMQGVTTVAVISLLTLAFFSGQIYEFSQQTAEQLSSNESYITAVLTPQVSLEPSLVPEGDN